MPLTWNDLTVNFEHLDGSKLVEDWLWLIGSALPILITSAGDVFLQNDTGEIIWLMTGSAELEKVADSYEQFQSKLQNDDLVSDWFLIRVIAELKAQGNELDPGNLYGFKMLPTLGGEYEPENFEQTDIEVHFSMSGQINFQIKDLPDGAEVNFKMVD